MTVVIGYSNQDISIMLTDTRLSNLEDSSPDYDGIVKLRSLQFPYGWCTGLGYSPYLEKFKENTKNQYTRDFEDLKRIFFESREKALEDYPENKDDILISNIFCSFLLEDRLVTCLFTNNGEVADYRFLGDGYIFIAYPSNFSEDKTNEIEKRYSVEDAYYGNTNDLITKLLNIFKEISDNSVFVSSICESGLVLLKDGDVRKYSISGHIDSLLENGIGIHFE